MSRRGPAQAYKGNVLMAGRKARSLCFLTLVTFETTRAPTTRRTRGFIRLNALRLRTLGMRGEIRQVNAPHSAARSVLPEGQPRHAESDRQDRADDRSALIRRAAGRLSVGRHFSSPASRRFPDRREIDVVQYVFAPIAFSAAIIFAAATGR